MYSLYLLNETFTNGLNYYFLNFLSLAAILCGIFVIISKNPIVSVLFLIGLFLSISAYLMMLGINFIGLSYLLVYVGAVSILFLFILMLINVRISELVTDTSNSIVRRCAPIYDGYSNIPGQCTNLSLAVELGQGESPRLNLASPFKGRISSSRSERLIFRAKLSMIKV